MWHKVNIQADIDFLLDEYFGFHDACICSIDYISGASVDEGACMHYGNTTDHILVIRYESQMSSFHKAHERKNIELRFVGLRRLNLIGYQDNYFCDISSCYLAFHKVYIIWSDNDSFDPEKYTETSLLNEPMSTFVVADRLEWRFTTTLHR